MCVVCVRACVHHNEKTVLDDWQARHATEAILVSSRKHNAKKNARTARGSSHQSIATILSGRKEKRANKPTHVTVYLFSDPNLCVVVIL